MYKLFIIIILWRIKHNCLHYIYILWVIIGDLEITNHREGSVQFCAKICIFDTWAQMDVGVLEVPKNMPMGTAGQMNVPGDGEGRGSTQPAASITTPSLDFPFHGLMSASTHTARQVVRLGWAVSKLTQFYNTVCSCSYLTLWSVFAQLTEESFRFSSSLWGVMRLVLWLYTERSGFKWITGAKQPLYQEKQGKAGAYTLTCQRTQHRANWVISANIKAWFLQDLKKCI